jgi:hypothetical protein
MCTVTYYKDDDKIILTSNRDENISRPSATKIKAASFNTGTIYYPFDPKGKGTWFATKNNGVTVVLLNGAERKHIAKPPYRKSRGLILLEIIQMENILLGWKKIDLHKIEPFTLIVASHNDLMKLTWNGKTKKIKYLDHSIPHIWSSVTLYSNSIIKKRQKWFNDFIIQKQSVLNEKELIYFHRNTQANDVENGIFMNRNNITLTKNITQAIIKENKLSLEHFDILTTTNKKIKCNF